MYVVVTYDKESADFQMGPYMITTALATLLEAFSAQNDNLILPVYGWAIGTLLGV